MADTKLTALTEDTTPTIDDLLYLVNDPAGTPAERKVKLENLLKFYTGLTADTTPTTDDLIATINDPGGTPVVRKVTNNRIGNIIQVVNTQTGAVLTGTTTIPLDDTIPQNTEGTEFMTLAITPTSTTNKLRIDVIINLSSTASPTRIAALFQDTTADALAVAAGFEAQTTAIQQLKISYYMAAGTTSATTFKVRAGPSSAATMTFNGDGGARKFGGVFISSITITEILA